MSDSFAINFNILKICNFSVFYPIFCHSRTYVKRKARSARMGHVKTRNIFDCYGLTEGFTRMSHVSGKAWLQLIRASLT